jgi:hypothetical protein
MIDGDISTKNKIIEFLQPFGLKPEGEDSYRSNRPWSLSSDSMSLTMKFADGEHGTFYDHVAGEGGSIYELAAKLGIKPNGRDPQPDEPPTTKRAYYGLSDYASYHGVGSEVFEEAGWREVKLQARPSLEFITKNGKRWRFLDGEKPTFKSEVGYKSCWYGLDRAIQIIQDTDRSLVICNGEPSVVTVQHYGIPAICVTGGEHPHLPDNLLDELKQAYSKHLIIVAGDCDDTGRTMALGIQTQLIQAGYLVMAVDLQGGKGFDLADYCALNKENSYQRLIDLPLLAKDDLTDPVTDSSQTFPPGPQEGETSTQPPKFHIWSVSELLETEFPEPRWAIPGILPEGLNLLGGRPKVGKSWLALQAAWSVSVGGMFFDRKIDQGEVLYFALEDSPRRLQGRLQAMHVPKTAPIKFINDLRPLHEGGLDDIYKFVALDRYRLLVIDTLTRALPGVDQAREGGIISDLFDSLQKMAIGHNVCLKLIDHTRKPQGFANNDPIDDILHLTAKTAIADGILALYKEQGKAGAFLKGRGRDFEDIDLKISFDPYTYCWQCEGDASGILMTEQRNDIITAVETLGKCHLNDVAIAIGINKSNCFRRLQELCQAGKLIRTQEGKNVFYAIPNI